MNIKARGEGFFAQVKTRPYYPSGIVIGQVHLDSCVAACCLMLLFGEGLNVGEVFIRAALTSDDQGALLSTAPSALLQFGATADYIYLAELTVAELRASVRKIPAVVFLKLPHSTGGHTVIVDGIDRDWVFIRDPWPLASGTAYCVRVTDFETGWLINDGKTGRAVIGK